jgi:hypothetical protein
MPVAVFYPTSLPGAAAVPAGAYFAPTQGISLASVQSANGIGDVETGPYASNLYMFFSITDPAPTSTITSAKVVGRVLGGGFGSDLVTVGKQSDAPTAGLVPDVFGQPQLYHASYGVNGTFNGGSGPGSTIDFEIPFSSVPVSWAALSDLVVTYGNPHRYGHG